MYVYVNTWMVKTKLIMVYIVKENPNQRLNVLDQFCSIKIISKQCFLCHKLAENYIMHIMLRCIHLLENREHLLENILNILDVNKYVDFENQSIEKQYITLYGCSNKTTFENITFGKLKQIMQCVSLYIYVYKIRTCLLLIAGASKIYVLTRGPWATMLTCENFLKMDKHI